jgi:ceramide glucosyltransferase
LVCLLLSAAAAAGLVVTMLADRAIVRTLAARPTGPRPCPPISILKPVKGVDEGLYDNLVSLARQDYPEMEILVGAADSADPALPVARRVAREFPAITMRIVACGGMESAGLNPKVRILTVLSALARHDHVLISDSNVRVSEGYLAATAAELGAPGVGMVTNLIVGIGERTTAALFENLHLATYVARATVFARIYLRHACVVGKSMLFRLSDLARVGGWQRVRDVLAEDYVLGRTFQQAGLAVALCAHPVATFNRDWTLGRFANRHLRWGQMRRRMSPAAFVLELLFSPTPFLMALLAVATISGPRDWFLAPAAVLGVLARLAADRSLLRRLRGQSPTLGAALWTIPKDLLVMGLWAVAGFRRTIDWRGNQFILGPGTRLELPQPRRPRAIEEAA